MKKIISIVGTRPNYIKLAAVSKKLNQNFLHKVINTGQHYDYELSAGFFKEFSFPKPDYNLEIGSELPGKQIANIAEKSEKIIIKEKPMLVIVYGDTNSTLGGALAAVKQSTACAHIESGLRSFDKSMPEEVNRMLVDHISSLLFCSSEVALKNLKKENILKHAYFVGDIMYDLLLRIKTQKFFLKVLSLTPKNYYYCTIHRQENTDDLNRLKKIFANLETLDKTVVLSLHPRTKKMLERTNIKFKRVKIVKPLSYSESITLIKNSRNVLTDSGGIQKEAYWLKIPCLTLRSSTEWPETVNSGWNKLVGTNFSQGDIDKFHTPKNHIDFYGKGDSSKRIVEIIKNYL